MHVHVIGIQPLSGAKYIQYIHQIFELPHITPTVILRQSHPGFHRSLLQTKYHCLHSAVVILIKLLIRVNYMSGVWNVLLFILSAAQLNRLDLSWQRDHFTGNYLYVSVI